MEKSRDVEFTDGRTELAERIEDVTTDFSVDKLPSPGDTKVKAVYNEIAGEILLHQILNILALIGKNFRITINATADDVVTTLKHQEALFETLKLCDTFSLMMQNYHSGANNILEKLKIAYLYLFDGFPDFAITDINAISKDVDAMRKAVGKVTEKVKCITTLTSALILTTAEMKIVPGESTTGFNKSCYSEEIPNRVNYACTNKDEAVIHLKERDESWSDNRKKVPKTRKKRMSTRQLFSCFHTAKIVHRESTTGFNEPCSSEEIPNRGNDACTNKDGAVNLLKERDESRSDKGKKVPKTGEKPKEKKHVFKSLKQKMKFSRYPKNKADGAGCNTKSKSDEKKKENPNEVINSPRPPTVVNIDERKLDIEEAKEAGLRNELVKAGIENIENNLKQLDGILSKSSILVEKWYKECSEIVEPSMTKNVEAAEKLTKEEKMKYWASVQFQQGVVNYYCRWRALEVYSQDCRGKVRQVRGELESYYTENLRPNEAGKFSWKLAIREADEEIQAVVEKYKSMKD